ncbi:MAG: LamG domain-containing protein [Actinobacteria bacterium]|nr:LamG domain-containing protein [Actinomycetota bacterium]
MTAGYVLTADGAGGSIWLPGAAPAGEAYDERVLSLLPGAYYKMNETSGDWADSSGSLRTMPHTTFAGNGEVRGVAGGVEEGDGTLAVHVDTAQQNFGAFDGVGHRTSDPFFGFPNQTPFSVSCWARPTSLTFQGAFSKAMVGNDDNSGGFNVNGWRLMLRNFQNTDEWGWCFSRGTQSTATNSGANVRPPVNQWAHLVGTLDANTQRLYVDGNLVSSKPVNPLTNTAGYGELLVGSVGLHEGFGGTMAGFNGDIDSIAVWDYTLSAADVEFLTGGGDVLAIKSTTTSETVPDGIAMVFASGTITVTLPSAEGISGRTILIKRTGGGTITIGRTSSQAIDGVAADKTLTVSKSALEFTSDGAGWQITAAYL